VRCPIRVRHHDCLTPCENRAGGRGDDARWLGQWEESDHCLREPSPIFTHLILRQGSISSMILETDAASAQALQRTAKFCHEGSDVSDQMPPCSRAPRGCGAYLTATKSSNRSPTRLGRADPEQPMQPPRPVGWRGTNRHLAAMTRPGRYSRWRPRVVRYQDPVTVATTDSRTRAHKATL
jgi:hypothetical protein